MPSSISFNGVRTFRPGVYAVIDASALGQQGISTGNVAVVGDFPMLEQGKPMAFSSARAMSDYFLGDLDMQLLAKIAFSPSTDERIGGGASQLFVVNAAAVNQAQHTFLDEDGDVSLVCKSKLHGKAGNKVSMDINQNANGTAFDINVRYNGLVEEFVAVESGALFRAKYTGAGSATLAVSPTEVKLTETFSSPSANADIQSDTAVSFALPSPRQVRLISSAVPANRAITVTGTAADGSPLTEVVELENPQEAKLTANLFASVTQISVAALAGGGQVFFSVDTLTLDPADFSSVSQMVDSLDAVATFNMEKIAPNLGGIPADELDEASATLIVAGVEYRADLHAIVKALESSAIIVPSRASGATKAPTPVSGIVLGGGTHAAPITTGYTAALEELLSEDVQIVTALDDALAIHLEVLKHCKAAQLYGRERCGYAGAPAKTSLANLFSDYSSKLNSRHVALVGQSIQYLMPDGTSKTLDPKFLALMVACMQAGSPVATPMTRKRPDILGVEQHDQWNLVLSNNEAIQKGILAISLDNLGLRIERSVTTYMTDDNPIYSEVSANESVNTSVRTLRARLEGQIGNPAVAGTRAKIESTVRTNLAKQVKDGIIKAFQNVLVEDKGDRFDIGYEVAAIEPLNFIKITANVVRISG
jgi:hypothetical protein